MELGTFYITAPISGLNDVFPITNLATPFIYILSMSADPTSVIYKFATKTDYMDKLQTISLDKVKAKKPRSWLFEQRRVENG